MRQYPGEDLALYIKRFHEKALDFCDPVDKEVLENVCLKGMNAAYRVFLENLSFLLLKADWASRRMDESVKRTLKSSRTITAAMPFLRKRSVVATVEKSQEAGPAIRNLSTGQNISKSLSKSETHILPCGPFHAVCKRLLRYLSSGRKTRSSNYHSWDKL